MPGRDTDPSPIAQIQHSDPWQKNQFICRESFLTGTMPILIIHDYILDVSSITNQEDPCKKCFLLVVLFIQNLLDYNDYKNDWL